MGPGLVDFVRLLSQKEDSDRFRRLVMDIQLASDLHFECYTDRANQEFLAAWKPAAEVLVLAGDIASAKTPNQLARIFSALKAKYKHMVYVPGNHEFYGTTLAKGWVNIDLVKSQFPNLHVLNNDWCILDGVSFYGGTGWFPRFDGDPQAMTAKTYMSDFHHIKEFEPDVYASHRDFQIHLASATPDVVVTHHLPANECVAPQYKGDALNAFFVSQFDVTASGVKLWVHGHTHEQTDVKIGQTRVVANPRAYPREVRQQHAFQGQLVLTL
jgi:predicted phosphodiesterase